MSKDLTFGKTISYKTYSQMTGIEVRELLNKYHITWDPKNPGNYALTRRRETSRTQ